MEISEIDMNMMIRIAAILLPEMMAKTQKRDLFKKGAQVELEAAPAGPLNRTWALQRI